MRGHVCALAAATAVALGACDSKVDGVKPVGGDVASPIEQERFLGRLHLDLTGSRAPASWIDDGLAALAADGDSAESRAGLADPLIGSSAWAELYVAELENTLFGGEDSESRYDLLCGILRATDTACIACPVPTNGDICDQCACAALTTLVAERAEIRQSAADLAGDATTADIGRRLSASQALRSLQDPDTTVMAVFDSFIGRAAEPEEQLNGRNMVFGIALPGGPAGLLFHRHGANYDDFLDIVFESEVYREAQVASVFDRYLGRSPNPAELRHFTAQLDAADPDLRPVVRAVVSSREYFDQ